jgi:hypothetical protein
MHRHLLAALAAAAVLAVAPAASAACLEIDSDRGSGAWVNNCGIGIEVRWNDQGSCGIRSRSMYPCSDYVRPNGWSSVGFTGYVNWAECQSAGPGDVTPVETRYGIIECR